MLRHLTNHTGEVSEWGTPSQLPWINDFSPGLQTADQRRRGYWVQHAYR